jgi:rod shape-determining protein MreC
VNPSRYRALALVLVLSLILSWQMFDYAGGRNPIRDAFSRVLSPVQFAVQQLARPFLGVIENATRLSRMVEDNQALGQENQALRHQIILLEEARIENETLRRQLDFKSTVPNFQLLAAEVIGHDPSNMLQYLVIDRGSTDGIARGMPVLAGQGLVGRIVEVSASSSKVMLITDSSSSVGAMLQQTRATGMAQGFPGGGLVMRYISQDDEIELGDVVLTSGLGGNFPKRLIIGQVASVRRTDVDMFQEVDIIPMVNLRDLEMVMVLMNFEPFDLAQEHTEE